MAWQIFYIFAKNFFRMKKALLISFLLLLNFSFSDAQDDSKSDDEDKKSAANLTYQERKDIQNNLEEGGSIPGDDELKAMGASSAQIQLLNDARNQNQNTNGEPVTKPNPVPRARQQDADEKVTPKNSAPRIKPSKIFGQNVFRNRNISSFDRIASARAPDNYIISAADQISISVWGFSDFNSVFEVDKEGYISLKETGRIYLKGLRFLDAKALIERKFSTFLDLKNSKIDISLASARVITVNVVGDVISPGSYTIPATSTAFNAITIANGTSDVGSVRNIYIRRGGKTIRTLDVYEFLFNPNNNEDFFLENNDYILVTPIHKVVSVNGAVKRPDSYELIENEGMVDLITYSGGIEPSGSTNLLVKRIKNGKYFYIDVNYDSLKIQKKNFPLENGDVITVKPIPEMPEGFIDITGSVRVPGKYEFIPGEKLSDLVMRAQGFLEEAFLAKAFIVRRKEDFSAKYISVNLQDLIQNKASKSNIELFPYDVVNIYSKNKFIDPYNITIYGSVRNPSSYLYGENLTLKDAIFLAGGFEKEAANNRIEISRLSNIGNGSEDSSRVIVFSTSVSFDLTLEKSAEDFKLHPFDQIFIRTMANFSYQKNITISGEVVYPGYYSLTNTNERLFDIIKRAGGLTEFAFPEGAKLIRYDQKIGPLFLDLTAKDIKKNSINNIYNYVLKEGDEINIPQINQLIAIRGAVNYPAIDVIGQINAPYTKGRHAKYYINNFGVGFAKGAQKRKTIVIQPGGFINKTVSLGVVNLYPKIKTGAIIVTKYKPDKKNKDKKKSEPVDWNKAIEHLTVKLTGILALYLLFQQIK